MKTRPLFPDFLGRTRKSLLTASRSTLLLAAFCGFGMTPMTSRASTAYGTIHNFDVVNDTGKECHGFEIEIEDSHSRDVTYTYNYNHYGVPKITEDLSNALHPKVKIRYESAKNPDGSWTSYTAIPSGPIAPTNGHMFTNPSVNFGGEHFGVGFYGAPTAVRYFWLVDNGAGVLVRGPEVLVSTPTFTYAPAVQQVQAAIRPVPPAAPPVKEFGKASWVKEIRTTTHNNRPVKLRDLVSDDPDDPNDRNWRNGEPDEVEVEWQLLQTDFNKGDGGANGELQAGAEGVGDGDEIVTRRYEFYEYKGPLDNETGEALAENVANDDLHGVGTKTANGTVYDLANTVIVGKYLGAQMSAFDPDSEVGLTEQLQDGVRNVAYPERTVVIPGNSPFSATLTGDLPPGLTFDEVSGLLSGTPTATGEFQFTVEASDADTPKVTKTYTITVTAPGAAVAPHYVIDTTVAPGDGGTTTGDGSYEPGADATVVANAAPGFVFQNWSEQGEIVSLTTSYTFPVDINHSLVATFVPDAGAFTAPVNVSATDGTAADKVVVSWDAVPDAVSYHVLRHTANDANAATEIGSGAATTFDDTTASPGVAYFYWVKAEGPDTAISAPSASDAGHRGIEIPTGLAASNDRNDAVGLTWSPVTGATGYLISRNTANDSAGSAPLGTFAGTSHDDTTAIADTDYYYWVRATSAATGPTGFSSSALGRRLPGGGPGDGDAQPVDYDSGSQLGNYAGLIQLDGGSVSGTASFRLRHNRRSGTGNVSGVLVLKGNRISLKGEILADGTFSGVLSGTGATNLVADLQVSESPDGAILLMGTLTDSVSGESHTIDTSLNTSSKASPSPFAGNYTILIPAHQPLGPGEPAGDGCGTLVVRSTGAILGRLTLGDGSAASLSGAVGDDGRCGIYKALYRTVPKGFLAGVLTFREVLDVSDCDGAVEWVKQPTPGDALFPNGFDLDLTAVGSRFGPADPGQPLLGGLDLQPDNITLWLEGSGVSEEWFATWAADDTVTYAPVGSESLQLQVNTANGLISGTWREQPGGLRVPFKAVIFQRQEIAGGNFKIKTGTGNVRIEPN
ncbi:MAG: putative Ig domain-containing protein [Verrucomicrobiae bacterium]|nr:putative Ig domain-containing protein [Verrucomicrobiae bacterium]